MEDLLMTNTYVPLSKETRRHKVQSYIERNPLPEAEAGPIEARKIVDKEERVIISINSNQRNLTTESDLTDPADYFNYVAATNYKDFAELYNLAKDLNRTVETYEDYVALNGAPTFTVMRGDANLRMIVDGLVDRSAPFPDNVADINQNLLALLNEIAVNANGRSDYESMANLLNAFVMSGSAFNPKNFWRPFYFTGYTNTAKQQSIRQIVYREQLPNNYNITLPRIIDHVKSIRLVSTEIPNTVNNVTERNNIITIQLEYKPTIAGGALGNWTAVPLDSNNNLFNFILVKMDIGLYTVDDLIVHMNKQINDACALATLRKYSNLFTVSWHKPTGVINIVCNRKEVRFHMKFYSELTGLVDIINPGNPSDILGKSQGSITSYGRDLWFLLGFPWPYEINSDGSNKYTQLLTNQVAFGVHNVFTLSHTNNDIFDRTTGALTSIYSDQQQLAAGKYDVLNTYKPYKYPDISVKYIYLVLQGYKSINHVNQFNSVITYKDSDIFAKVLLTGEPGAMCYNTFVDNPLIFLNAKDKIEAFEVSWIDEQGELVDFNKVDHSFTLEIVHYVTQVTNNGYSTSLGDTDTKSYPDWLRRN